jgi:N-acetylmuramoyl-L-alanine amidase
MSFLARAASFAAVTFCAGLLLGTTTPSYAQALPGSNLSTLNALLGATVPAASTAPTQTSPGLQPAVLQMVQDIPQPTAAAAVPDADDDFSSLADAVAAQDGALSDSEVRCLAAGVYYESKGEPLAGQLAVAQTIINRTRSGRFPKSICSVLTQAGQFSFVRRGVVPTAEGRNGWSTAVAVAKVAHADLWDGVAETALYFHARRVAPGWRMQKVASIGNHVFYR